MLTRHVWKRGRSLLAACIGLVVANARAEALSRDTLLTDAPATPAAGTLRMSGGGSEGTSQGDATLVATVQWTPLPHLSTDAGLLGQTSGFGPTARLRYQLLEQAQAGIDLAVGVRYKNVGFRENNGEIESLLAAGHRWGRVSVIANAVYGHETGGPGQDLEGKVFGGFDLSSAVRLGLDSRLQAEFVDENGMKRPTLADMDVRAGPAVSWQITSKIQLQGLVGAGKPSGPTPFGPVAMSILSVDI